MATTRDYIEYLNDQVDIAPANSQEEFDAARLILSLMDQHSLETKLQEFTASTSGTMPYRFLAIPLFLGVVLAGIYGTPAAVAGLILVFVNAVLFLLKALGYDLLSGIGIKAHSQNVVGVHRAEGPLVVKGNRPIVVVAHYDTPRNSFLYAGPLARFQPMVKRYAPVCIAVACVFGLFQLLGFIPETARRIFWILGILAALPPLVLGIDAVYQLFSSCTDGAVDNKASVAAMLGVMSKVRPGDDDATGYALVMDEKRAAIAAELEAARAEEERLAQEEELAGFDAHDNDEFTDDQGETDLYDEDWSSEDEDELQEEDGDSEPDLKSLSPEDLVDKLFADEEALAGFGANNATEAEAETPSYLVADAEYEVISDEAQVDELPEDSQDEEAETYDEAAFAEMPEPDETDAETEAAYASLDAEPSAFDGETPEELDDEPFSFMPSFARVRAAEADSPDEPEFASEAEELMGEVEPQIVTDRYETIEGVRHGEDVIRSLRMLPKNCDVEYLEPRLISRTVRPEFEPDYDGYDIVEDEGKQSFFSRILSGFRARHDQEEEADVEHLSFLDRIRAFFAQIRSMILGRFGHDRLLDAPSDEEPEEDVYNAFEADFDEEYETGFEVVTSDEAASVAYENHMLVDESVLDEEASFAGELLPDIEATAANEPLPDIEATAVNDPLPDIEATAANEPLMDDDPTGNIIMPGITFTDEPSPTDDEIDLMDANGLTEFVDDDLDATNPQVIKPAPKAEGIDDPMWGKSEYEPPARSVGRRATLFDLPDPSGISSDPFAEKPAQKKNDERSSSDDGDSSHWKGGATTRAGLRDLDSDGGYDEVEFPDMENAEYEPADIDDFADADVQPYDEETQEEMRDAVLSMGDDELIAHDVWFVALGASELDHAGMTSFLREYRSQIRGAFLVNLDCVGAGDLNLLTNEGVTNTRRGDRRIMRLLTNIAEDLHIPVERSDYAWDETDATPAMRKSVRSLTVMGMEDGVPALSHTSQDTLDRVNSAQVSSVAAMVTELIRRS